MKTFTLAIVALMLPLLSACIGMPDQVSPVTPFNLERYLGTWYEIARLDHSFERGLEQVSATYSMRDDGGVRVLNRGYNTAEEAWDDAEGKAYFVEDSTTGYLKVSFFGPFYGSYVIFDLDQDQYEYAFVSGPDTSYLWLLSRSPQVSAELKARFETAASQRGFDLSELLYVQQ